MNLPEGFTSRALEFGDLDAVYAVGAACDTVTIGEPDLDKADIEAYWKAPSFSFARNTLGVFDGLQLTALAHVRRGKHFDICVHPDYQGRGLGTALAEWAEGRARSAGEPKGFQSAPVADEAALRIFAKRGYSLAWTSWVLALPASATIPWRELHEDYDVRPYRPGAEERAAYEVVQTAFGEWPDRPRTPFEDWEVMVLGRETFTPDNLLVATFRDEVVGVCWVVDGDRAGWVHAVAVDKAHRNRGIAQVLLAQAFAGTRSRGLERAELATDLRTGALGLYESLGMQVTRTYEDWTIVF